MSDAPACRVCGMPLPAGFQRRIGVCVWCVKSSQEPPVTIPAPRYGGQDG